MNEPHCSTCICGRRAPVQGSGRLATVRDGTLTPGAPGYGPGTVAWSEHLLAWSSYAAKYGTAQTAERVAERGGFGFQELTVLLGRTPRTWEPAR